MLALKDVTYITPPPASKTIFEETSFFITPGSDTLVLGDNGSGKSTLVRLLLKFIYPLKGEVKGGTEKAAAFFDDVESQLFFTRVNEELNSCGGDRKLMEKCLNLFKLKKLTEKSTIELSYSQKARLALACAYLTRRPFIIIDSPPRDDVISGAIEYFSGRQNYTHLLLLPEGTEVKQFTGWQKFIISGRKIKEAL